MLCPSREEVDASHRLALLPKVLGPQLPEACLEVRTLETPGPGALERQLELSSLTDARITDELRLDLNGSESRECRWPPAPYTWP